MNRPVTSNEIESVILKPSTSKNPNQMISWVKSTKYLEKNICFSQTNSKIAE